MATRLVHTCHRVTDLKRSLAFYRLLGFEERSCIGARNLFVGLPGDGDRLQLTEDERPQAAVEYGHIALAVDDLEDTLASLLAGGIRPEEPAKQVGELRLCFVRDPDGYCVELIEYGASTTNN